MVDSITQADPLEERPRPVTVLAFRELVRPVDGRHHYVLEGCHARQKVKVLKDEPDLPAPQPGSFRFAEPRDVLATEPVPTARGTVKEPQEVDECRLSRTR